MAARVPARLTPAEGRRFGLTVGIAFLVLAALAQWRGFGFWLPRVLGSLGGLLAVAGLVIPTRLGLVEHYWMALAHAISKVTTPIVMGVMYVLVLTPFGALRRAFGGNPLSHQKTATGYWKNRPEDHRRSRDMRRQF